MKKFLLLVSMVGFASVMNAQVATSPASTSATPVKHKSKKVKTMPVNASTKANTVVATTPAPVKPAAPVSAAPAPTTRPGSTVTPTSAPVVSPAPATTTAPQAPAVNPNAPEIQFSNTSHDFGTVPEGPQAKYEFEFTNKGHEPLVLSNVQASCGCTTPEWSKEPIMPGQTSKITAIYNTQGRPNAFTKTITVTSNAKTPTVTLTIRGTVEPKPAQAAPEKAPSVITAPVTPEKK